MLAAIAAFANDAAALEKTLRFCQAISQVIEASSISLVAQNNFTKAKGHFALARRFFRLHKWIDCGSAALRQSALEQEPVRELLSVSKWGFLTIYFFLEMTTITNAMQLTTYDWATHAQSEAARAWFFALISSILLRLYDVGTETAWVTEAASSEGQAKQIGAIAKSDQSFSRRYLPPYAKLLCSDLIIDMCDLVIPGSAIGWIPLDKQTVGVAMAISSLLAGKTIWDRVQSHSRSRPKTVFSK